MTTLRWQRSKDHTFYVSSGGPPGDDRRHFTAIVDMESHGSYSAAVWIGGLLVLHARGLPSFDAGRLHATACLVEAGVAEQ